MNTLRTDSWASGLTEEQRWQLYYKYRSLGWEVAVEAAVRDWGIDAPSHTAFYEWKKRMDQAEQSHRLEQAAVAAAEAAALSKVQTKDEVLIGAFKSLAADIALRTGNAKDAGHFVQMAVAIADRLQKAEELSLKARAQETKDEQLKLAREKFMAAERRESAAKSALGDKRLTDADKVAKMKEIFG